MTAIDRFAAFRPDGSPADLFSRPAPTPVSHTVPPSVGHDKPQKTAVSHQSPLSHHQDAGAKEKFPLTAYMVALMKHPDIERADPVQAAKWYGLSEEVCRAYLTAEKQRRAAIR